MCQGSPTKWGSLHATTWPLDAQSFFVIADTPLPPLTKINVVLNWFEELKQRAPGGAR